MTEVSAPWPRHTTIAAGTRSSGDRREGLSITQPDRPGRIDPEQAPRLAHELLGDAERVGEEIRAAAREILAGAQWITMASSRRRAASFAAPVLLARYQLDEGLAELIAIAECCDELFAVLGPTVGDEPVEIARAREALGGVSEIVRVGMGTAREHKRIGEVATNHVSGLAEAEMVAEEIMRDLRRRDLDAADQRIPRLEALEREMLAEPVTRMLARVRRRRAVMNARGRGRAGYRDGRRARGGNGERAGDRDESRDDDPRQV